MGGGMIKKNGMTKACVAVVWLKNAWRWHG